jgi:hypothetical protein
LFGGSLPPGAGWAQVTDYSGRASLAGVEIFGTHDGTRRIAGLELINPLRHDGNGVKYGNNLYFSHIARDQATFWTGLALVNVSPYSQTLTLRAYGNGGQEVGSRNLFLESGEKYVATAEEALTSVASVSEVDWLLVQAEDVVAGFELFGTWDGTRLAGMETASELKYNLSYPYFDPTGNSAHGIAVLNPNTLAAEVTFTLYDNAGIPQAVSEPFILEPNVKLVRTIGALFPDLPATTLPGWLAANADIPITGFELIVYLGGQKMSSVLAQ